MCVCMCVSERARVCEIVYVQIRIAYLHAKKESVFLCVCVRERK